MKKSILLTIVAFLAISVAFTSCTKKSDEKAKGDIQKIVDDYKAQVENLKKLAGNPNMADPSFQADFAKFQPTKADFDKKYQAAKDAAKDKVIPEDMKVLDEAFNKNAAEFQKTFGEINTKMQAAAQAQAAAPAPEGEAKPEAKK